jgi:hypothetical protein
VTTYPPIGARDAGSLGTRQVAIFAYIIYS